MDMQWESTVNTDSPDGSSEKRSARHWMLLLRIAKEQWWKSTTIPIHSVREQSYHSFEKYSLIFNLLRDEKMRCDEITQQKWYCK